MRTHSQVRLSSHPRFETCLADAERRMRLMLFPSNEIQYGGAERDRTVDPLLAKQVLSQLSYSPTTFEYTRGVVKMVGLGRLELPTSPLSGVRSNQLSYRPGRYRPAVHQRFACPAPGPASWPGI